MGASLSSEAALPAEDFGFHEGLPIAALLIFRAALHWRCFQADTTVFFDRVMETVSLQVSICCSIRTSFYWISVHLVYTAVMTAMLCRW